EGGGKPNVHPLPPRSRGGPVEALRPRPRGLAVGHLPPRSRGGPVEATISAIASARSVWPFRLDHEAAPLKLTDHPLGEGILRAFRLDHEAAPLKPKVRRWRRRNRGAFRLDHEA